MRQAIMLIFTISDFVLLILVIKSYYDGRKIKKAWELIFNKSSKN